MADDSSDSSDSSHISARTGVVLAVSAYLLWGVLPGFFLALAPAGAFEVVASRILWSLVFCVVLLTVTRSWATFRAAARTPRTLAAFALAGVLIYVNWQLYVLATLSGRIVEGALGYFINPLVTILLGVFFLRERLRVAQWVAVGVSVIAVLVLTVNFGKPPWLSLALAFSFGFYGLVKNRMGRNVDAITGLTLETAWLVPVATVILILVATVGPGLTFGTQGVWHALLLASTGVVTVVPLLMFAGAARRVPLVMIGLTQYLAPILQFLFGVIVMGEPMPAARWAGFGLVWISLIIITVDGLRHRSSTS